MTGLMRRIRALLTEQPKPDPHPYNPRADPHWQDLDREQRASARETDKATAQIRDWRTISIQERLGIEHPSRNGGNHDE